MAAKTDNQNENVEQDALGPDVLDAETLTLIERAAKNDRAWSNADSRRLQTAIKKLSDEGLRTYQTAIKGKRSTLATIIRSEADRRRIAATKAATPSAAVGVAVAQAEAAADRANANAEAAAERKAMAEAAKAERAAKATEAKAKLDEAKAEAKAKKDAARFGGRTETEAKTVVQEAWAKASPQTVSEVQRMTGITDYTWINRTLTDAGLRTKKPAGERVVLGAAALEGVIEMLQTAAREADRASVPARVLLREALNRLDADGGEMAEAIAKAEAHRDALLEAEQA